jgi:predicted small secreted protein
MKQQILALALATALLAACGGENTKTDSLPIVAD